jgi:hypothetical protein
VQELISAVDAHPTSPEISFFFKDELETKHRLLQKVFAKFLVAQLTR